MPVPDVHPRRETSVAMGARIIVERDVEAQMRDGTILRAGVYRPDTEVPLLVLLQRTPYGKGPLSPGFALTAAERGYAVVIQDTRGCWASDGDGYTFVHEKADGYDSVEWAAAQPWANGKVGMFGASFIAYTQWATAVSQPPSLAESASLDPVNPESAESDWALAGAWWRYLIPVSRSSRVDQSPQSRRRTYQVQSPRRRVRCLVPKGCR
jgi:predicted acyl esterase